jgi:hypothetical protein
VWHNPHECAVHHVLRQHASCQDNSSTCHPAVYMACRDVNVCVWTCCCTFNDGQCDWPPVWPSDAQQLSCALAAYYTLGTEANNHKGLSFCLSQGSRPKQANSWDSGRPELTSSGIVRVLKPARGMHLQLMRVARLPQPACLRILPRVPG